MIACSYVGDLLRMDKAEYSKKVNRALISSWAIIDVILVVAYIIEIFKGLRSVEYVAVFCLVTVGPLVITIIKNYMQGGTNLNIKYYAVVGYCIFYTFSMFTTQERVSFVYIIPMISIMIVYCDAKLVTLAYTYAITINMIVIHTQYIRGYNTKADMTFYEIQIACLLLSCLFLNIALQLVRGSVQRMFELSDDILIDELSKAYNRKFVSSNIIPLFDYQTNPNISMAFLDIDNFRDYNTKYGHEVGDLTIKTMSKVVKDLCGKNKKIYFIRIGGDEFILIAFGWAYKEFIYFCEKLRRKISDTPVDFEGAKIAVSVSMGLANTLASNVNDYFDLREIADAQLYVSKNGGRNRISCAAPPLNLSLDNI